MTSDIRMRMLGLFQDALDLYEEKLFIYFGSPLNL